MFLFSKLFQAFYSDCRSLNLTLLTVGFFNKVNAGLVMKLILAVTSHI